MTMGDAEERILAAMDCPQDVLELAINSGLTTNEVNAGLRRLEAAGKVERFQDNNVILWRMKA